MNKIYKIFYRLFRKIIFLFPPEFSHYLVLKFISFNYFILKYFFKFLFDSEHDKLKRNLLGLDFKNPIGLAAGFDKNADYIRELTALGFGFIEIGTVTPLAQKGNAKPRIFRLSSDNALVNTTVSFAVNFDLPATLLYVASSIHTSLLCPNVDISAPNDAPRSSIVAPS